MKRVYRLLYMPDHPRADITGMVKEHILVAAKILGVSFVDPKTIIHHVDFNKAHNNIENLLPMSRQQHQQLPERQFQFIKSMGLVDEWIEWWKIHKDDIDEVAELEMQYIIALNEKERINARLAKREAKGQTDG